MEDGGAAMGAAVAGAKAFFVSAGVELNIEKFSRKLQRRGVKVQPFPENVAAFHNPVRFLDRFALEEDKLIRKHSLDY
jgi:hypothetical protein